MWVLQEELLGAPAVFSPLTQSHWFLQPEVVGTYLPGPGTLGGGPGVRLGLLASEIIPLEFLSTTHGCWSSLFQIHAPPTSLDGGGFFNSAVVRFPFNSVYDGSE